MATPLSRINHADSDWLLQESYQSIRQKQPLSSSSSSSSSPKHHHHHLGSHGLSLWGWNSFWSSSTKETTSSSSDLRPSRFRTFSNDDDNNATNSSNSEKDQSAASPFSLLWNTSNSQSHHQLWYYCYLYLRLYWLQHQHTLFGQMLGSKYFWSCAFVLGGALSISWFYLY